MLKDAFPTPSSHGGELCDTAQGQMEEVASQMGASSKMPFRYTQLSRLPSVHSLSLECQLVHSTNSNDQLYYCIHITVTLEEGKGDQLPPSHMWSGSLITNILQEACPGDQITKAVVLAPGEAVLFFRRYLLKEGLLYNNAWHVEFGLHSPVSWAGRTVQVETAITTMPEDHWAIADAIMETKNKGQRALAPQRVKGSYPVCSSCYL